MTKFKILVIAAVNSVVLYVLSFLATGGDGSADGVYRVRWAGFAVIGLCTVVAWRLSSRNGSAQGVGIATASLPIAFALGVLGLIVAGLYSMLVPGSKEFEQMCKAAGATYLQPPASPVRSIAYDWAGGGSAPAFDYFDAGANGHVSGLRGGAGKGEPAQIEFSEGRCCRFEGPPSNGKGPYVRRPNGGGPYFGVSELSADALVTFSSRRVDLPGLSPTMTRHDIVVSDRRDGAQLATLTYFLDNLEKRGCASPAGGSMDEKAFVRKALGVPH